MIKLITTTSDRSKCAQLERSLIHFGWDYHVIEHQWSGFLDKLHETYKYLKQLEGYTHFIYTDAWDTFAMRSPKVIPGWLKVYECRILISAERNCYPYAEKEPEYPKHESPWHFVNGGGFMGEVSAFIEMYEANRPTNEMNDQVWLTNMFLKYHHEGWIKLDYECLVFQTIGFCEPGRDFSMVPGFFANKITHSFPALIHGNGHTPMDEIYKLI